MRCAGELVNELISLISQEVSMLVTSLVPVLTGGDRTGVLEDLERRAQQTSARVGQAIIQGVINAATTNQPGPTYCEQGHKARLVQVRGKQVQTLLGQVEVKRGYYHCGQCASGFAPFDKVLGVAGSHQSPGLVKAACLAGMTMPFKKAEELITLVTGVGLASAKTIDRATKSEGGRARALIDTECETVLDGSVCALPLKDPPDKVYVVLDGTGAPMVPSDLTGHGGKGRDGRARTREVKIGCLFTQCGVDGFGEPVQDPGSATYLATFQGCETFGGQVLAEYLRRGLDSCRQPVVIGDGAKWIWKLAAKYFPEATEIVDYYHACEHVHDLGHLLENQLVDRVAWVETLIDCLDQGDTGAISAAVHRLDLLVNAPGLVKPAAREVGYFATNHQRMQYAHFKTMGYFIGSGAVESACNTLVAQRAKQAGMHWTIKGLDPILALRALHQSQRTDLVWEEANNQTLLATAA